MILSALAAMSGSCVTISSVVAVRAAHVEQQVEHGGAGLVVEIAGGLVGEQDRGLLTSARAMATRCCSPPLSCDGR